MKQIGISQANGHVYIDIDGSQINVEIDTAALPANTASVKMSDVLMGQSPITNIGIINMVLMLVKDDGKIMAIKAIRQLFVGITLVEAKAIVDSITTLNGRGYNE